MRTLLWIFGVIGVILLLTGLCLIFYDYSEGFFFFEKFVEQNKNFRIPLIAVGAACLTFAAFLVQVQANSRIQDQFRIQQFESQFYKMLDLHVNNVSSFKIYRFEAIDFNIKASHLTIEGQRVFLPMVKELHYLIDLVHYYYKDSKPIDYDGKNQLAYEIFFHGINSTIFEKPSEKDAILKELIDNLTTFKNTFRNSQSELRELIIDEEIKTIKLRYVPFCGHETRLGHYYRHLYQTVKYTVTNVNDEIINYEEGRQYLRILRAQLSSSEQLMLYYNYIMFYGQKWDYLGDNNLIKNRYLSHYRMIHNVPLNNKILHQKVINPRKHFEDFIKSLDKSKKDSLFEHGDYNKEVEKQK